LTAAFEAGREFVSPGVRESPGIEVPAHGGDCVSPAKATTARTNIKVTETPGLFRFFMLSP